VRLGEGHDLRAQRGEQPLGVAADLLAVLQVQGGWNAMRAASAATPRPLATRSASRSACGARNSTGSRASCAIRAARSA
jgi:hypothetical protein